MCRSHGRRKSQQINDIITRKAFAQKLTHTKKKGSYVRALFFAAILKVAKTTLLAMPINMNNEGCPKSWTEGSSTFEVATHVCT